MKIEVKSYKINHIRLVFLSCDEEFLALSNDRRKKILEMDFLEKAKLKYFF